MRPRVAVIAEQFWHKIPGGTARATEGTLQGLLELDRFDLIGVAARHRKREGQGMSVPIAVEHAWLPRPALYEVWHRLSALPVEQLTGPVDLIWAAAMVCPPPTAPMVVTVNDLDFLHHPERLSARGRSFFPKAWEVTGERAARIVCPTRLVADHVIARGIEPQRVTVVPLGVSPLVAEAHDVARVRRVFDLPEVFALWVGTMEPRKNLPRVVEAVASIEGLPLVVVGPDGWAVDGQDLLAPLAERAHRLGRVSEPDLRALYAAASVFLLPSLAEGFGLPVAEAMMQGTPVVTSAGTATEEVAGGAAELADPTSSADVSRAIRAILEDSSRAATLAQLGTQRAAELTWQQTGIGYAAVFDEVINQ